MLNFTDQQNITITLKGKKISLGKCFGFINKVVADKTLVSIKPTVNTKWSVVKEIANSVYCTITCNLIVIAKKSIYTLRKIWQSKKSFFTLPKVQHNIYAFRL